MSARRPSSIPASAPLATGCGDQLLIDDNGNSEVSAEDDAIAIADLLEHGGHERERITVAW
jgi:putative NADH-flavin reductase